MDDVEFSQVIETFIGQQAGPDDAVPAELVFAILDQDEQPERGNSASFDFTPQTPRGSAQDAGIASHAARTTQHEVPCAS